jgi:hypothetical protein
MARSANRKTTREPIGIVLTFMPHEYQRMKHNDPGPSGKLGGWPKMENLLVARTCPFTLECALTAKEEATLIEYIRRDYGPGGPNGRVRASCITAFRRLGIELLPGFANYERKEGPQPPSP